MKEFRWMKRGRKWLALVMSVALLGTWGLLMMPLRAEANELKEDAEAQAEDTDEEENTNASEDTDAAKDTDAEAEEQPEGLERLFQFELMIEGKEYQLPVPLHEFLDAGWVFQSRDDESRELYPGNTADIEFGMGEKRIQLTLLNRGEDADDDSPRSLKDCEVVGLTCRLSQDAPDVTLPMDLGFETPRETLEATLGRPNKQEYLTWIYGNRDADRVSFGFDDDKGGVTVIKIWHPSAFENPENYDGVVEAWPEDLPDPLKPTEPDAKLVNGVYSLGGELYHFPTPLALLLQDGWKVLSGPEYLSPSTWSETCVLYKGNEVLRVSLDNLLKRDVPMELGYITNLRLENNEDSCYGESLVVGDGIGDATPLAQIFAQVAALEPQIQMQGDNATILIDFPKFFSYELTIENGELNYIELKMN